jgi:hypothetical protein
MLVPYSCSRDAAEWLPKDDHYLGFKWKTFISCSEDCSRLLGLKIASDGGEGEGGYHVLSSCSMFVFELPTTGSVSFGDLCIDKANAYTARIADATSARANVRAILKESKHSDSEKDYLRVVKVHLPRYFSPKRLSHLILIAGSRRLSPPPLCYYKLSGR